MSRRPPCGPCRRPPGIGARAEARDGGDERDRRRGQRGGQRGQPQRLVGTPKTITAPSTATATKLTDALDQEERDRAARDPSPPASRRASAPRRRAPARRRRWPGRSSRRRARSQAISQLVRQRHRAAEDRPEHQHVGSAGQRARTRPRSPSSRAPPRSAGRGRRRAPASAPRSGSGRRRGRRPATHAARGAWARHRRGAPDARRTRWQHRWADHGPRHRIPE